MKTVFIIILLLVQSTQAQSSKVEYWEQYSENDKQEIFKDDRVTETMKAIYNSVSPEEIDFEGIETLFDTICIFNNKLQPLYFFLFNKLIIIADGYLAESMGYYSYKIINQDAIYVLKYLQEKPEIRAKYISYLGFEFYYANDSKSALEKWQAEISNKNLGNLGKTDIKMIEQFITDCIAEAEQIKKDADEQN